jgi:HEAT repeat protein
MPQTNTPAAKPKPAKPVKPPKPEPPLEFQEGAIATMDAAALIRILTDEGSSEFQKAKACQRIGEIGPKEAVPVLATLLDDEHLSVYARYALEPIPDPSADDALRAALSKLEGNFLIGVINSIGKRRDAKAGSALAGMLYNSDTAVARAAAAALGNISGEPAVKELRAALGKTTGMTRMAVADASLVCAERLLEDGKRDQALGLYTTLSAPDIPKPVRLAAMQGIIREETSISRPR